jgi:hypothetical protein
VTSFCSLHAPASEAKQLDAAAIETAATIIVDETFTLSTSRLGEHSRPQPVDLIQLDRTGVKD